MDDRIMEDDNCIFDSLGAAVQIPRTGIWETQSAAVSQL